MAWETRAGGHYYYRVRRENGRVQRQYIGTGELAEAIAAVDRIDRSRRERERERERWQRAEGQALARRVEEYGAAVDRCIARALVRLGYHRPQRRPWRRRMATIQLDPSIPDDVAARLMSLTDGVAAGEKQALAAFRELCLEWPTFLRQLGNQERQVRLMLYKALAGKNAVQEEAIVARLRTMRDDLAGEGCNPIERLLIERVATDWLHLQVAELDWVGKRGQGLTFAQSEYYQRTFDRAQGRYLKSLKKLAQVRRLRLPALQINIAGQQVVVAG
jgi:hypothetical protein